MQESNNRLERQKILSALARPILEFEPKSAAQVAAEESAQIAKAQPGDIMPDGSVCAGISPETHKPMYTTREDESLTMTWTAATRAAREKNIHDHQDWRLPTIQELNELWRNRDKGALSGTFNRSVSTIFENNITYTDGRYWSSTEYVVCSAEYQRFVDGLQHYHGKVRGSFAVRFVRG